MHVNRIILFIIKIKLIGMIEQLIHQCDWKGEKRCAEICCELLCMMNVTIE